MNQMRATTKKRIRGHILFLLQLSGTATTERTLEIGMISSLMVTSPDIREYLDYLMDRGYIQRLESKEYGVVAYKLTADGVDLLEGTKTDPGVIIGAAH